MACQLLCLRQGAIAHHRHRYYDPSTGRYTTLDPIGLAGGLNSYQYTLNPINWVDPLGLNNVPIDSVCGGSNKNGKISTTISPEALEHSSLGNFTYDPKGKPLNMKAGGHGQENVNYLEQAGMPYQIDKTYSNGVRVGIVENHKQNKVSKGVYKKQSWFPDSWTRDDIAKAAQHAMQQPEFNSLPNGEKMYTNYNNVRLGIIKTNGELSTVFPDAT